MGFFTVNIFNRAKLMTDNNAEYIARCTDALKCADIPNELHTRRLRNYVPKMMQGGGMVDYGVSQRTMNPVDNVYTYTLFVPRKYLEKAKRAVHI